MNAKPRRIYALQEDLSTLYTALEVFRNTNNNVLITNCISRLLIGGKKFHTIFDTALYSEDNSNVLIIKEESTITPDVLKELLKQKNIEYNEVVFREYLHFKKPESCKELFFVSNEKGLKKAIITSKDKNIDSCTYYPKIKGNFRIKYFFYKEKQESIDEYHISGIVELDDKLILLVKDRNNGLNHNKILRELEKMNMSVNIDYSEQIEEPVKEKELKKRK